MKIAGIIAEYNPFHTGHAYQIARTRAALGEDCAVLAVMSGNWVQGGRPAVLDKWTRTRLALLGGADLVLELPTVWAASSAESFARGAAGLLEASGAADVLSFGSECGEAGRLQQLAACLDSPSYETEIRRLADSGRPFAAARQQAVQNLLGEALSGLLSAPNNNLGVEYIRALNALKSAISPMTVRREGARHDALLAEDASPLTVGAASGRPQVETKLDRRPETAPGPKFLSATQLRLFLEREDWAALKPYLPEGGVDGHRHRPEMHADEGPPDVHAQLERHGGHHCRRGITSEILLCDASDPAGERSVVHPHRVTGSFRMCDLLQGPCSPLGARPAVREHDAAVGVGEPEQLGVVCGDRPLPVPLGVFGWELEVLYPYPAGPASVR